MSSWFVLVLVALCAFLVLLAVFRWLRWSRNEAQAERRFLAEVEAHNRAMFTQASLAAAAAEAEAADARGEALDAAVGFGLSQRLTPSRSRRP